jgi:predicted lipid-binding transport protein (Tim44 family)
LGAVLAFGVSFQVVGIDIVAIGAILMIVGFIGLAMTILTIAGYAPWYARAGAARSNQMGAFATQTAAETPTQPAAPAAQTPTNSSQASVVVIGAPFPWGLSHRRPLHP